MKNVERQQVRCCVWLSIHGCHACICGSEILHIYTMLSRVLNWARMPWCARVCTMHTTHTQIHTHTWTVRRTQMHTFSISDATKKTTIHTFMCRCLFFYCRGDARAHKLFKMIERRMSVLHVAEVRTTGKHIECGVCVRAYSKQWARNTFWGEKGKTSVLRGQKNSATAHG